MTISDETLSAFIDQSLSEREMEAVREAVATDEQLAQRLEALLVVNGALKARYSAIDDRPLPEGLIDKIKSSPTTSGTANVVQLRPLSRFRQQLQPYAAVAASITLMVGIAAGYFLSGHMHPGERDWQQIAEVLESIPSGESVTLKNGETMTPRLSFISDKGDVCRQYNVVQNTSSGSANIACKTSDGWRQEVSLFMPPGDPTSYNTASQVPMLDSVLDNMMNASPALSPSEENILIEKHWQE